MFIDSKNSLTRNVGVLLYVLLVPVAVVLFAIAALLGLLMAPIAIPIWSIGTRTSWHPIHWLRARLGWGRGVDALAKRLALTADELRSFTPHYTECFIPKRSGGARRLLIPDDQTRSLQQALLHRVFKKLRAHECAMGFEEGLSIVHNALPHVGQRVVIKMDVVDFFPSTNSERLESYFKRVGWNQEAASLLVKLTTFEGGLPMGAPTSPRLSNLVNYLLDVQLHKLARRRKGTFTRYADDITFSFPKDYPKRVRGIVLLTKWILQRHGYQLHKRKTRTLRCHQRQSVTGLNVNTKVSLPRDLRRRLRAARHRRSQGQDATWTDEQLAGWTAIEAMIENQVFDARTTDDSSCPRR